MQNSNIIKLLGIKRVKVNKIQIAEDIIKIDIELEKSKIKICPVCGSKHMN